MKKSGFSVTISPKDWDVTYADAVRDFLKGMCKDYQLVVEKSDNGHTHMHAAIITKTPTTTSAAGQKLRRFWDMVDTNSSKHSVLCKKLYEDVDQWMDYLDKGQTIMTFCMNDNFDPTLYKDELWPNVPEAERRANIKWKQFARLDELLQTHDIQMSHESVEECKIAMNKLAWSLRVYECPLDPRKFKQLAIGWYKYRIRYEGPNEDEPDSRFATVINKRKRPYFGYDDNGEIYCDE